jgi:excisionase family DNA binding protein
MKATVSLERLAIVEKLAHKKVLTFEEACIYSGTSQSYMYKIVSQLPFSKPNGKRLFIAREALDEWLLSNKSKSLKERECSAATYVATH